MKTRENKINYINRFFKKPNFLIIGAPRSGTTTLYSFLKQHPEICLSKIKEPQFFSWHYNFGIEWYLRLFFRVNSEPLLKKLFSLKTYHPKYYASRGEKLVGEASTAYINYPDAAKRIYKFNPNFKLIFILRNPTKRAISAYKWKIHNRGIKESLKDLIELRDPNDKTDLILYPGFYYTHIKRFLKYFKQEQIYILLFEKFIKNPEMELIKLLDFLGANSNFRFKEKKVNLNPSKMPNNLKLQAFIIKHFRGYANFKEPMIMQGIRFFFRKILNYLNHIGESRQFPHIKKETKAYIRRIYSQEINSLEEMLKLDLNEWK